MDVELKSLFVQLEETLKVAAACGEKMSAEASKEVSSIGEEFNAMMVYLYEALELCSKALEIGGDGNDSVATPKVLGPSQVFPIFSVPRQVYPPLSPQPSVIYPRAEAARAAMSEAMATCSKSSLTP